MSTATARPRGAHTSTAAAGGAVMLRTNIACAGSVSSRRAWPSIAWPTCPLSVSSVASISRAEGQK
eukprot:5266607-Prymnesium_polylepis.2